MGALGLRAQSLLLAACSTLELISASVGRTQGGNICGRNGRVVPHPAKPDAQDICWGDSFPCRLVSRKDDPSELGKLGSIQADSETLMHDGLRGLRLDWLRRNHGRWPCGHARHRDGRRRSVGVSLCVLEHKAAQLVEGACGLLSFVHNVLKSYCPIVLPAPVAATRGQVQRQGGSPPRAAWRGWISTPGVAPFGRACDERESS